MTTDEQHKKNVEWFQAEQAAENLKAAAEGREPHRFWLDDSPEVDLSDLDDYIAREKARILRAGDWLDNAPEPLSTLAEAEQFAAERAQRREAQKQTEPEPSGDTP